MIQNKIIQSDKLVSVLNIDGHEPNGIWEPHRHDYYEVMWSMEAHGHHSIDFFQYPLKRNRIFLISPQQIHDARQLKGALRVIAFKSDLFEPNTRHHEAMVKLGFDNVFEQPYLDVDDEGAYHLNALWELLRHVYKSNDTAVMESLLSGYLRYLSRNKQGNQPQHVLAFRDARVQKVESLIERFYKQHKKCEFYANSVSLTPKHINDLMRVARGKTVTKSIIDRVCLEAKRDLSFSTKSIQTISQNLGYEDSSYFSRLFKKQTGYSPSHYRTHMFK